MYLWKCWRDTRSHFIGSLIALPALCVVFTIVAVRFGDPDAMRGGALPSLVRGWATTTEIILGGFGSIFSLIWGLILGSYSLGGEFKEKTVDFLLVRPRRRRYWVWAGWVVGVWELAVTLLLAVLATFGTLVYLTGHVHTWRVLATIMPLVLGSVVAYGLTYFLTLFVRSGQQGLSYGIGILFIDLLLPTAASYYWKFNLPSVLGSMVDTCRWLAGTSRVFPASSLAIWAIVALAFPLAAQMVLERAEV